MSHPGCHGYLDRLHGDAFLPPLTWTWMWRCRSLLVPQDAICTLNTLQTNASCLEQVRWERRDPRLQLQAMKGFLDRAGLTVSYSSIVQKLHLGFIKLILLPFSLSDVFYITGGGAGPSQYHSCDRNKGQGIICDALAGHFTAQLGLWCIWTANFASPHFPLILSWSLPLSVRAQRARSPSRFWGVMASVQASTGETAVCLITEGLC